MKLENVFYRGGGRIVEIASVEHDTRNGVPVWFYRGDVQFPDGTVKRAMCIDPRSVVHHAGEGIGEAECECLDNALEQYLLDFGEYHKGKRARTGDVYYWTPRDRKDKREI